MEKVKRGNLSGMWKNELGSVMKLKEDTDNHKITGTYGTAVEFQLRNKKESADLVVSNKEESADLVGYTNTHLSDGTLTTTITFCMAWKNEGSCSAFTGQIFQNSNGTDVMKTTWLLHSPVKSSKDNWEATRVGENTFTRVSN